MIRIIRSGEYKLIETKSQTKILILDNKEHFAWINTDNIGQILVASRQTRKGYNVLAFGNYRLYEIRKEPELTDLSHLELHAGNGIWQGYLLPTGLPKNRKKRSRIIPTNEIVTKLQPLSVVSFN